MNLKNYMETMVLDMLDIIIEKTDCCTCERCRFDVAAYALNNLPPKYIVSNEVYAKLSTLQNQLSIDIMTQLTAGCELVKSSPRH